MKKKNYIIDRKKTRDQPQKFLMNFLGNFSQAAALMHSFLPASDENDSLLREAKKNYLISMVSCVETFYHDLFVHILENDKKILESILNSIKEKPTLSEIYNLQKEGISFSEIAASKMTYQSIEEVESTF
jgi:hypothetical protein